MTSGSAPWPTTPAMTADVVRFDEQMAVVDGDTRLTCAELVQAARDFGTVSWSRRASSL